MPQFLINPSAVKGDTAVITGGDAKHVANVLRLKAGDWLMLTDGKGGRWRAEIVSSTPKKIVVKLLTTALPNPPALPAGQAGLPTGQAGGRQGGRTNGRVALAQAVIKHDRFEWIVQKAVELGCSEIIPFISERTIPKFATASSPSPKTVRWQKIADEAAKQCGTVIRPEVNRPLRFAELMKELGKYGNRILFWEGENNNNLNTSALKHLNTLLIIGPEGGFSAGEVEAAKNAGAVSCSLGPLILRVETAAIAALTLVQEKLGYFDKSPDVL